MLSRDAIGPLELEVWLNPKMSTDRMVSLQPHYALFPSPMATALSMFPAERSGSSEVSEEGSAPPCQHPCLPPAGCGDAVTTEC